METRIATLDDAIFLAKLHADCFAESKWSLAQITDSLVLDTTLALSISQGLGPEGLIMMQIVEGEAEVLTFCISPSQRRKGFGNHLLCSALAILRQKDVRRVFLEVAAENDAALALYQKSGFL